MEETARLTDDDLDLTEERIAELDRILHRAIEENREVAVTCFVPDEKKQGGSFKTFTAQIKRSDPIEGLILKNGMRIPLWSIRKIVV